MSLEKAPGKLYEPSTLTNMHRSIARYLRDAGYPEDIVRSAKFALSNDVLATKRQQSKAAGNGNKKNRAQPLSHAEEEELWNKKQMGTYDPWTLNRGLWYILSKSFGFRGVDESHKMKWGDVELKEKDGKMRLEFTERATKTRTGLDSDTRAYPPFAVENSENPQRCPIEMYRKLAEVRPSSTLTAQSPFYLQPNHFGWRNGDWYKDQALGRNKIAEHMKTMCKAANIGGRKTNHSVRKTSINDLVQMGFPPTIIQQYSGHKSLASINNYSVASHEQQEAIAHAVTRRHLPAALGAPPQQALPCKSVMS